MAISMERIKEIRDEILCEIDRLCESKGRLVFKVLDETGEPGKASGERISVLGKAIAEVDKNLSELRGKLRLLDDLIDEMKEDD